MPNIYFDIETIPAISDEIRAEVAATIKPPGNMSKPETIAKWEQDEKPALVLRELERGGLFAERGQLLAFTVAIDDGPVSCVMSCDLERGEPELIKRVLDTLSSVRPPSIPVFIGHNITGFDLPFIRQRAWANAFSVPRKPFKVKAWDDCIEDTMLMWSPDRDRRISLAKLCRVLGVDSPKTDLDGSQIWPAYQAGEFERIRAYAIADVVAVRECHRCMT